jgi:hypothetical protein
VETVAVYWEPIIRTYGIDLREGRLLAKVLLQPSAGVDLAPLELAEDRGGAELIMAAAGREAVDDLALWLVLGGDAARALHRRAAAEPGPELTHPVDVLHFHGPHFGDRYGIVSAALSALRQGALEPLLVGCTGASVYLAVRGGDGPRAVESLRRAFTTPGTTPGAPATGSAPP